MTIVNDDSRVVNKLEASLTDNARVVFYDCHMYIAQATGPNLMKRFWQKLIQTFGKLDHFINISNVRCIGIKIPSKRE